MKAEILRMTKRSRNGPRSRQYHMVPRGVWAARPALCGTRPRVGAFDGGGSLVGAKGWGSGAGKRATCIRCIAAEAKARTP